MARVVFHDPFLEMLGGGEKVLLTILEHVSSRGHQVTVLSPRKPDPAHWRRLNLDVDPRTLRWRPAGQLSATPLSARDDLLVSLANHFPPLSMARHGATILQFPSSSLREGGAIIGRLRAIDRALRLHSYDSVLCYSTFVADAVRERLGVRDPVVIAPPVDLPETPPAGARAQVVLAVGRFFASADANHKKHDVLIDAWRRIEERGRMPGWELHLAGGLPDDAGSTAYLASLKERARGLEVHFHPNAAAEELSGLYRSSSLFWHATGLGETRLERHEHFGITTVEAMAHGVVPVVVALGGQLEVVADGVDGRLWHTLDELVEITESLVADPGARAALAERAAVNARRFSKANFLRAVRERVLEPAGVA